MTYVTVGHPDSVPGANRLTAIVGAQLDDTVGAHAVSSFTVPAEEVGDTNGIELTLPQFCAARVEPFRPATTNEVVGQIVHNPAADDASYWVPVQHYGSGIVVDFLNADDVDHEISANLFIMTGAKAPDLILPWLNQPFQGAALDPDTNSENIRIEQATLYDRMAIAFTATAECLLEVANTFVYTDAGPQTQTVRSTLATLTGSPVNTTVDVPIFGEGTAITVHNSGADPIDFFGVVRLYRLS